MESVIRDCLEGKQGAWNMLVDMYSKKVFNMAYQFSGSYQEAEDLTQDVFMKLYHQLGKYDFQRNFTAWLLTVVKNYMIDEYRRTKWEKRQRDDFDKHAQTVSASDNPEMGLQERETKKILWEGLNRLSSDVRMAIILKEIQGKKYEDVAEIMNLPVGTVKSRINRGRLQLAKILHDQKEKIHGL